MAIKWAHHAPATLHALHDDGALQVDRLVAAEGIEGLELSDSVAALLRSFCLLVFSLSTLVFLVFSFPFSTFSRR
jgi:hypothetical protein